MRLSFVFPVKPLELSVVGNFGRTLAIGSGNEQKHHNVPRDQKYTLPRVLDMPGPGTANLKFHFQRIYTPFWFPREILAKRFQRALKEQ